MLVLTPKRSKIQGTRISPPSQARACASPQVWLRSSAVDLCWLKSVYHVFQAKVGPLVNMVNNGKCFLLSFAANTTVLVCTSWERSRINILVNTIVHDCMPSGTVASRFVTRSFHRNLQSFHHSQFVTPELPNQRRFGCPALCYSL